MKKLFVHNPLFRLLSPLFSGALVYVLILLINNNIAQLEDSFLGQELYVCIGLSYLIQEYARFSLVVFSYIRPLKSFLLTLTLQLFSSIAVCMILVTSAMYIYFYYVLGYTPNNRELLIFNSIFSLITIIYLVLYMSHHFLYKINTKVLAEEIEAKDKIEADYLRFKNEINPELLFESLESLLVLMRKDSGAAEKLSDNFSSVYRYMLSKERDELVFLSEELPVLQELIELFSNFNYRKVNLKNLVESEVLIVPQSLLSITENIIRSTIPFEDLNLTIEIIENEEFILIKYEHEERLRRTLDNNLLRDIAESYKYYSDTIVDVFQQSAQKIIKLPKLRLK